MRHIITILLTLLLSPVLSPQEARTQELCFQNLSIEDGLSSRKTLSVIEDNSGFIWIATDRSIDRFDGSNFHSYILGNNDGGQKFLTKDSEGRVYTVIQFENIYIYNPLLDCFETYVNTSLEISPNADILSVWHDGNDNMYIGTNIGLYKKNTTSGKIEKIISRKSIWSMVRVNSDLIAFCRDCIYRIAIDNNEPKPQATGPIEFLNDKSRIISSYFDKTTQKLYVGTFNSGLYIADTSTGSLMVSDSLLTHFPIRSICPHGDSDILIGTDGDGLYCIDRHNGTFKSAYMANNDTPYSLSSNGIYSIISTSNKQTVWIATYTGGINYSCASTVTPNFYRHEYKNNNSLSDKTVNSIVQDDDGNLWFGTLKGISTIDTKTGQWKHFLSPDKNYSSHRNILSILQTQDGTIWAGGYMTGLLIIDPDSGKIKRLKSDFNGHGPGTDSIYTLYIDSDGDIWIGGINGKLSSYNPNTKIFSYYPVNIIYSMAEKSKTEMYIGTWNGLLILNKETGSAKLDSLLYEHFGENVKINSLYANGSSLWIGTDGKGLIYYDTAEHKIKSYDSAIGLKSDIICSVSSDQYGKIWAATETELLRLNPDTGKYDIFRSADRSKNWLFTNSSMCSTHDGDIFIGSIDGVVKINPHIYTESHKAESKLYFTDLNISYKKVPVGTKGSPLSKVLDRTDNIILTYKQNTFSINFADISFFRGGGHLFSWQLRGFDPEWTEASSSTTAGYTNIPAGKYSFCLRSLDHDRKTVLDERCLHIKILPPIYATPYAYITYAILFISIVFISLRIYTQWLDSKHSKDKVRFFINVAHDIRTPLTLIKAPLSDMAQNYQLPNKARADLDIAISNTDKLFEMVNTLLDIENINTSMMRMTVSEHNLNKYLDGITENLKHNAQLNGIQFEVIHAQEDITVWFDKRKMDKILNNLIANSLKYTIANKNTVNNKVTITATTDNTSWCISVEDTGVGISKKEQRKFFKQLFRTGNAINPNQTESGLGLILTKNLVYMHSGTIAFESQKGKGSRFTVTFKKGNSQYTSDQIITDNMSENTNIFSGFIHSKSTYSSGTILILDNNPESKQYLSNTLSQSFSIIEAEKEESVIEILNEYNVNVVIADIDIKGIDVMKLCKKIKSDIHHSHISVVLLTLSSDSHTILEGLKAGADDYIIKPFDINILKQKISNLIINQNNIRAHFIRKNIHDSESLTDIETTMNSLDKAFIDKLTEKISSNISDTGLSVSSLCKLLGMSHTLLFNKTKTLTGLSPNEFIRTMRMQKAAQLIKEKRFSIGEVSDMVGFSDQKYFSTAFKKHFGISPKKFETGNSIE